MFYLFPLERSKLFSTPQPSLLRGLLCRQEACPSSSSLPAASPPLPGLPCLLPVPSQGGGRGALFIRVGRATLSTAGRSSLAPLGFSCKGEVKDPAVSPVCS